MSIMRCYTCVKGALRRVTTSTALELLHLHAEPDTRVLVISGKPIVHSGPFAMKTMAEVKQVVADYN